MTLKEFPVLYKKSKKAIQEWKISVRMNEDGSCDILSVHGQVDGKMQTDVVEVKKGKNIGKSNETTPFEQACSQAQSKWNKQIDKGYTEDPSGESKSDVILPMLAEKYEKKSKHIVFPAYVQPKLNGCRCLSYIKNDQRVYQSRLGKLWSSLSHLTNDLDKLGIPITDGEIYCHGMSLQDILSLVKKERIDSEEFGVATKDLQYWIYDIVDDSKSFEQRKDILLKRFMDCNAESVKITSDIVVFKYNNIVYVPTLYVVNEDNINTLMNMFLNAKYEGAIVRNKHAVYQINKRSNDLQKVKIVLDEEFEIIGGYCVETGREKGTCIFKCKTQEGKEFDVRPKGTMKKRKWYWDHLDELIGKMLTCEFQEWTKEKTPFHARGVAVRDYE